MGTWKPADLWPGSGVGMAKPAPGRGDPGLGPGSKKTRRRVKSVEIQHVPVSTDDEPEYRASGQKLTVRFSRTNLGCTMLVGCSHVPPSAVP